MWEFRYDVANKVLTYEYKHKYQDGVIHLYVGNVKTSEKEIPRYTNWNGDVTLPDWLENPRIMAIDEDMVASGFNQKQCLFSQEYINWLGEWEMHLRFTPPPTEYTEEIFTGN